MSSVPVIYETPSRRQYFRVSAPAEVTFGGRTWPTKDWSSGGFSVEPYDGPAAPGDRLPVRFALDFQGFAISFTSDAKILRRQGERMAAEFIGLGEREHHLLRYFTSALISGQMAPVEGVLKNLDRPVTKIATNPPAVSAAPVRNAIRRISAAILYLVIGLAILGFVVLTILGNVTHVNVQTAVTSAPLEQVISADVGVISEMNVTPNMAVRAGQPLFRVDSETSVRNVQQARQDLETAQIALQEAIDKRLDEEKKLGDYQAISRDQLAARKAQTVRAAASVALAAKELERYKALVETKTISEKVYDAAKASYDEAVANLNYARAEEQVATTSDQSTNTHGHFFSGNYLVGELETAKAEEAAARAQVKVSQAALDVTLKQDAKRLYQAQFPAVVERVFKSRGMTVDRGEALIVLRRTGMDPQIDAYLTQEEAGQLAAGARGTATITASSKRYDVEVVTVDRTAGFLKDIQTPKLQQPVFQWRDVEDRSAYAKLTFIGLSAAEREAITPGLPVYLSIPRKRRYLPVWPFGKSWLGFTTVHAATPDTPRLWPAQGPLFTGARVSDPAFAPVRRRIIEAADAALRIPPAPVETLHSAGVTDQSLPEFQASRRAFQDADHCAMLGLAFRLTGKAEYQEAGLRILEAWARTNRPTGMPIDETRLDPFLWSIDLLGAGARTPAVTAWLERWQAANRAYHFGPITATNNHKTHHLKVLIMLDRLLDRESDYAKDMREVEQQLKANLPTTDGKSIDYDQRDAMHYQVFDMEGWIEIALVSNCCGDPVDRGFHFVERTLAEDPSHVEFAKSTAPIDRKRAAGGFGYAKAKPFDVAQAARAIFAWSTLPGRQADRGLWKAAGEGEKRDNLLYEARYYLWNARP